MTRFRTVPVLEPQTSVEEQQQIIQLIIFMLYPVLDVKSSQP